MELRQKLVSGSIFLTFCTSIKNLSQTFHALLGKSNCFGTLEFHVVNLIHCVKSVRIRIYSGPHFPAFGLNTERYSVFLRI